MSENNQKTMIEKQTCSGSTEAPLLSDKELLEIAQKRLSNFRDKWGETPLHPSWHKTVVPLMGLLEALEDR